MRAPQRGMEPAAKPTNAVNETELHQSGNLIFTNNTLNRGGNGNGGGRGNCVGVSLYIYGCM